ncbi:lipid II flippase MurJ [Cytobacillus kochii]|uniref:lipid II flippase MurJ n=1 Tax=Cytobacillus kochii TaxID=859143 RepID=UPI00402AC3DD
MLSKLLNNDYSLNLINKVYTVIMGLISSIFLTRYLGVIYKGDYAYITQIVLVVAIILNLGIHQSYSFFYRKNVSNIFSKYVNIYSLQFTVHILIGLIVGILFNDLLYIYICMMVPFSVFAQQMESTMAVENIRLKIKLHMVNVTLRMIISVFMYFTLESNLLYPVLLTIGVNFITIAVYLYFSKLTPNPSNNDFILVKEVLAFSWLPMLTALLITFNYSIDILFLKHMGTPYQLGIYSTAVGLINYFWLIPDAFKEVLVSRVARSHSIKSIILSIKASLLSTIIIIIAFFILGEYAINIMYGTQFSKTYEVTLLLSMGAVSMIFYKMIGTLFLAEGKRWFYFLSLLISVIVNVIANIFTIPKFGMYGAAISSVISYSLCGLSFLIYFLWQKKLNIFEVILILPTEIKQLIDVVRKRR